MPRFSKVRPLLRPLATHFARSFSTSFSSKPENKLRPSKSSAVTAPLPLPNSSLKPFPAQLAALPDKTKGFVKDYSDALSKGKASVFAGAGLSVPSGFVNWAGLLAPMASELKLDISKETDLISLAQYYCNQFSHGRATLAQAINREFSQQKHPSQSHQLLASLPIASYWTTNFDSQIEVGLSQASKTVQVMADKTDFGLQQSRDTVVYKLHGDAKKPDTTVISKDDFEAFEKNRGIFKIHLQSQLSLNRFLFLGYSFNDPNVVHVLGTIRGLINSPTNRHFWLTKHPTQDEFNAPDGKPDKAALEYKNRKFLFQTIDLERRYGLVTVGMETYKEVPKLLGLVKKQFDQNRVFISGCADYTYRSQDQNEVNAFLNCFSRAVTGRGYTIVSGGGLGMDNALSDLPESQRKQLVRQQVPITENAQVKRQFRENLMPDNGFAVFVFGNVAEEGMVEEFRIAVNKGLCVIPVGCTALPDGQLAVKSLWEHVNNNLSLFYPKIAEDVAVAFQQLATLDWRKRPQDVVNAILHVMQTVRLNKGVYV